VFTRSGCAGPRYLRTRCCALVIFGSQGLVAESFEVVAGAREPWKSEPHAESWRLATAAWILQQLLPCTSHIIVTTQIRRFQGTRGC
jgi:hypothetical protein